MPVEQAASGADVRGVPAVQGEGRVNVLSVAVKEEHAEEFLGELATQT